MSIKIILSLTVAVMLMAFSACQKEDNTVAKPDDVVITITSPQQGQVYKTGDVVEINAEINNTTKMHGIIVRIYDADGGTVFEKEQHSHTDVMTIAETWVDTLSQPVALTLEVIAVIEHDNLLKSEKISFSSQP